MFVRRFYFAQCCCFVCSLALLFCIGVVRSFFSLKSQWFEGSSRGFG